MPAQDPEILTIAQCRRLLSKHSHTERQRIVSWLMAWTHEEQPPPTPARPVDPRQADLFNG